MREEIGHKAPWVSYRNRLSNHGLLNQGVERYEELVVPRLGMATKFASWNGHVIYVIELVANLNIISHLRSGLFIMV